MAGALLAAAGDIPERLRSEAAFASRCGVSHVHASSGDTTRHRLNRGGDRIANNVLWRIGMTRLTTDDRTQGYLARRTQEGHSKREIIRCLKRYVAPDAYRSCSPRQPSRWPGDGDARRLGGSDSVGGPIGGRSPAPSARPPSLPLGASSSAPAPVATRLGAAPTEPRRSRSWCLRALCDAR
ncbi:MAG: transposase [Candidatus Dormibacteria bacterium]